MGDKNSSYWSDWRTFCEQATTAQLENIIEKEAEGGRHAEAEIARSIYRARGEGVDHG